MSLIWSFHCSYFACHPTTVYITVPLYTMVKSTSILFILFFALILRLEKLRWSLVAVTILISTGLFLFGKFFAVFWPSFEFFSFSNDGVQLVRIYLGAECRGHRWPTLDTLPNADSKTRIGFEVTLKVKSAVKTRESQSVAKFSKMREFFPYFNDSLISKILLIIFQNVYYLVLKLTWDKNRKTISFRR